MRKFAVIFFSIFVIIVVFNFIFGFFKSGNNNEFITTVSNRPIIIAHGGSSELFPGNTMIAFDGVDNIGVDMLEMSIVLTKDNILITHDNDKIDDLSDGKGYVRDFTYEDLTKFNFGYNFKDLNGNYPYKNTKVDATTFEEVLKKYGTKHKMNIEIINTGEDGKVASETLYKLLTEYRMTNRIIVHCNDDATLKYFKEISGENIMTSASQNSEKKFIILNKFLLGGFYFGNDTTFQFQMIDNGEILDKPSLIQSAHKKNIAIHYSVINDESEMKRLIELGADGLITDRPDLMRKVLQEMGFIK